MAEKKLSEAKIRTLTEPGVYGDGAGLWLRIHKSGSANWLFIYRRAGIRREFGLGGYRGGTAPVSLALAREKAAEIRDKLARGLDPSGSGNTRQPANRPTFKFVMTEFLEKKESGWRNVKHRQQWHMTLNTYAVPLHNLLVSEITVGDIEFTLAPHWMERPETADRLRMRVQGVLDYAIARQWRREANPAAKAIITALMPDRGKLAAKHHAALPYKDVKTLVAGLRTSKGVAARAVEFMVLTAARTGEALGATFHEVDFENAVWTIPAVRMKAHREHRVPLTDRALEIVREMQAVAMTDFIFGGSHNGKPVSATAATKALRLYSPDKAATLHGLRSAFRDWCGEETEAPREVAEAALAHRVGNEVELAYRRGDALEKRRALMQAWANYAA